MDYDHLINPPHIAFGDDLSVSMADPDLAHCRKLFAEGGAAALRAFIDERAARRKRREEGVPDDYGLPLWDEGGRVHDWHNHVPDEVQEIWHTFTDEQRQRLAAWAEALADQEHWE